MRGRLDASVLPPIGLGCPSTFAGLVCVAVLCDSVHDLLDKGGDMEDRYSLRIPIECSAVFSGESVIGEGRVLDVSLPGCLIESPEAARPGDYVRLKLCLPDGQPAVDVPLAVVRWAKGNRLGVEFIRSSEEDTIRLTRFVHRHRRRLVATKWKEGIEILAAAGD